MEAPDNIYLWETLIVNGGYDPAWHKNSFNEGDVEYIRKDKIREMIMYTRNISQTPDAAIRNWDELIKKIDEL